MRRVTLLLTVATFVVAMLLPAAAAFAQPASSLPQNGNPSCFGAFARSEPGPPGPGQFVRTDATTLAGPGTPGSGTDDVASNIGLVQLVRQEVCPTN